MLRANTMMEAKSSENENRILRKNPEYIGKGF